MDFQFNDKVIDIVIESIKNAEEWIKIAVFQIHRKEVFEALSEKLIAGKKVEIITLPKDSINDNVYDEVVERFEDLIDKGAEIHFLKWGVGDPRQTKTANGRWYSYHGKFIVTDKEALGLSANMIENEELDAVLSYNDTAHIEEFDQMFARVKYLFCVGGEGNVRSIIRENAQNPDLVEKIFQAPKSIIETKNPEIIDHWINGYPQSMVNLKKEITTGLFLLPFDFKSIDLYHDVVSRSLRRVFISTESFTDESFVEFLNIRKTRLPEVEIKVLTGGTSQDYAEKTMRLYKELIANGIEINVPNKEVEIHSKLIITDDLLIVGSVNLNKINLGFEVSYDHQKVWRQNTETVTIEDSEELINSALVQYNKIWNNSVDIIHYFAEKLNDDIKRILARYNVNRSTKEMKTLFGLVIIKNEIKQDIATIEIAKLISFMKDKLKVKTAKNECLFSALVLYNLKRREHTYKQLNDKLSILDTDIRLQELLGKLISMGIIENDDEVYRLKPA